jgi:hypothetical protein
VRALLVVMLVACGGEKQPEGAASGSAPKPVPSDAAVAAIDAAAAPPSGLLLAGKPLSPGCFAYSAKHQAWACIGGELLFENSAREGRWEITFPGSTLPAIDIDANRASNEPMDFDALPVLPADAHAKIEKQLADEGFAPRPAKEGQGIVPKQTVKLAGDTITARWTRAKHPGPADGEYHVWKDAIAIECKSKWVDAWTADAGDPKVQIAATSTRVLVEWQNSAGREGGRMVDHGASVFALETCAVVK